MSTLKIKYTAIRRLESDLTAKKIPHVFSEDGDGFKILYPEGGKKNRCIVREHQFSVGHEDDKLEMVGLLTDEERMADTGTKAAVCGNLDKDEVLRRILGDFEDGNVQME